MVSTILQLDFIVDISKRGWVGDVIFVTTRSTRLLLAVLLDLRSRKVNAWSMLDQNKQSYF